MFHSSRSERSTVSRRISSLPPERASVWTTVPPAAHTAMWTVPGGLPSAASGPATPVVAAPTEAPSRSRTPAAIAPATSGDTVTRSASRPPCTPRRAAFPSVAYAITPPRKTAEAPGTVVIAAPSSPPVSDSATATVCRRCVSRLTIWAARPVPADSASACPASAVSAPAASIPAGPVTAAPVPATPAPATPAPAGIALTAARLSPRSSRAGGRRPAVQAHRAHGVVDAGDHGDRHRGRHHRLPHRGRRPRQNVQRDRHHLQQRL